MICKKCHLETPDNSKFCCRCGTPVAREKAVKSRGNGQGTVYKRGKTWTASVTLGYKKADNGKIQRKIRTKGGFKTKRDAVNYLPQLKNTAREKVITLQQLYDLWFPTHRAGKSTMDCYRSAWKYYAPIAWMKVPEITVDDLQECIDECPHGRRTKENMKALTGLLYKYAIPRHYADINMGMYLIVSGDYGSKPGIPLSDLEKIKDNAEKVAGASYVLCHCYLGFRPSEFLALDIKSYNAQEKAFVGGAKTEAGKNRTVTVSPKIQPIIDKLISGKKNGPIFCKENGREMQAVEYRELFYDVLEKCGIENPITEIKGKQFHTYTPHSCRHTFATLMKRVDAADKDKLELMGHTSTEMLRHYQDVSFDDLRRITDAM